MNGVNRLVESMCAMERDIVSVLEAAANLKPEKALYSFLDRDLQQVCVMSHRQVFEDAKRLAAELQKKGLGRTPVLLVQQHNIEFVRSFWGCLLAGAWPMPCSRPRGRQWQRLADMAIQSGASALLTSSAIARLIPEHLTADIQLITTDTLALNEDAGASWQRPKVTAEDVAFIQYTSGSTSDPKGVVITHGNLMDNLARICRDFDCRTGDRGLSWLPLHHDMGLIGHVLQPLYAGIPNYFMSAVDFMADPGRWLEAISRYQITISGGPSFAYELCTRVPDKQGLDLSHWRLAYCGSDRIVPNTLERFHLALRHHGFSVEAFFPCYGMAESTLYICGMQGIQVSQIANAGEHYVGVGRAEFPDVDIRIVNPATGQRCAQGESGEIWIRSASVSPGYYRRSLLSRQHFNQSTAGQGGYFRTGDLGFIQQGQLYFTGRVKNVIKVRGRSLHAEDIESLLLYEIADMGLTRCVALGIDIDGADTFVVLAEQRGRSIRRHSPGRGLIEKQLGALICDSFGVVPHSVHLLSANSLPMTSSGKPIRSLCMEHYRKMRTDQDQPVRGRSPQESLNV